MTTRIIVPAFLGGISQQSDAFRRESLLEDAVNVEFLAAEGCTKRFPAEHVSDVEAISLAGFKCIFLERDDLDYVIAMGPGSLRIYDTLDGSSPVIISSDQPAPHTPDFTYLTGATYDDLRYQVIADAVYILNRSTVTARLPGKLLPSWVSPSVGDARGKGEAGLFIKQTNLGVEYSVEIKTVSMSSSKTVRYTIPDETFDETGRLPYSGTPAQATVTSGQASGIDPIKLIISFVPPAVGRFWAAMLKRISGNIPFNSVLDLRFRINDVDSPITDWDADPLLGNVTYTGTNLNTGDVVKVWREDVTVDFFLRAEMVLRAIKSKLEDLFPGDTFEATISDSSMRLSFSEEIEVFEVRDSESNLFSSGWTNVTENITDLPLVFKHGAVVKVAGANTDRADDYYVEFATEQWARATDSDPDQFNDAPYIDLFAQGVWNETVRRELPDGSVDPTTMPYLLQRKVADADIAAAVPGLSVGDIYFDLTTGQWTDRSTGDEVTAEEPSFIGNKINDLFFHQNRLGFLSNSEVIMAEIAAPENFWRTTVFALPDSDPIDVSIAGLDGDNLNHAIEFDLRLFVFSDEGQASVFGRPLLGPKTVEAPIISAYRCFRNTSPARLGQSIFFAEKSGNFAQVREYVPGVDQQNFQDQIVTLAVPKLIPSTVRKLITGSVNQMVGVLTDSPNTLFVYQFVRNSAEQIQASWTKWEFPAASIIDAGFISDQLFLLLERDGRTYLERMTLGVGRTDVGQDFAIRADRLGVPTGATYSKNTDTTAWLMPWVISPDDDVVLIADAGGAAKYGSEISVVSTVIGNPTSTVTAGGDLTGQPVRVGIRYDAYIELSKPLVKADFNQGRSTLLGGNTQVRDIVLYLSNTGYLKGTVTYLDGDQAEDEFLDDRLGVGDLDTTVLRDGEFKVSIHADPEDFKLVLSNDTAHPSTIVSGAWGIRYNNRHSIR